MPNNSPQDSRLLIVSGTYPQMRCGVAPYVCEVAKRLTARGVYKVNVLTSRNTSVEPGLAQGYGVFPAVKKWGVLHTEALCRSILAFNPNVVYVQNPTAAYSGWRSLTMSTLVPRLKHIAPSMRVVVMQHDIAVGRPILRRRYRPMLRAADAVVVSNMRDELAVKEQGVPAESIFRAPLGSYIAVPERNDATRREGRRLFGIDEEAICIAYFGFVLPARNIDILLNAISLLRHEGVNAWGLIMGGEHPNARGYLDKCRNQCNSMGLNNYVVWTGFASDQQVGLGLMAADIFVSLPDRGADLRNTSIITAIRAKLPVVTSRNERFFVDEELAQMECEMVPPRNITALKKAIYKHILSPPSKVLLHQLSENLAPERIWARHIDMLLQAFTG
ncbi:MAG: glycosyltransferase family 4 protein [Sedimentisphaerales bacterium]|nr:glycosyltransferase family 4 protein [Sedimentisphaerales bacterium]